jgi:hypothetical protein
MDKQFKILELRFSNIKCFCENNCIDFRKNINNNNIELIAPNSHGKTAIRMAILFCLYGKKVGQSFQISDGYSKKNDNNFKEMFNKDGTEFNCSLLFTLDNETYLIRRIGNIDYTNVKAMLYKIKNGKREIIINPHYPSNRETNNYIEKLIGTYNNFIMIACINDYFIDLTSIERYLYLVSVINHEKIKQYLLKIEKCANKLLSRCFNFNILMNENPEKGIKIKFLGNKLSKPYNVMSCSRSEKLFMEIAIKFAFMKILPCIKSNLLILDFNYGVNSILYSQGDNLKKMFEYIQENGISVMILSSVKNIGSENNFMLNIKRDGYNSTINNVSGLNYNGIYSNKCECDMIDDDDSEEYSDNEIDNSDDEIDNSDDEIDNSGKNRKKCCDNDMDDSN